MAADERRRADVIYLTLIAPVVALPALLLLDRLERWTVQRRQLRSERPRS
jgi:hypothetical protein